MYNAKKYNPKCELVNRLPAGLQGNAIRPTESGRLGPIFAPYVDPTTWAAGTLGTILRTRRRRSLSA